MLQQTQSSVRKVLNGRGSSDDYHTVTSLVALHDSLYSLTQPTESGYDRTRVVEMAEGEHIVVWRKSFAPEIHRVVFRGQVVATEHSAELAALAWLAHRAGADESFVRHASLMLELE